MAVPVRAADEFGGIPAAVAPQDDFGGIPAEAEPSGPIPPEQPGAPSARGTAPSDDLELQATLDPSLPEKMAAGYTPPDLSAEDQKRADLLRFESTNTRFNPEQAAEIKRIAAATGFDTQYVGQHLEELAKTYSPKVGPPVDWASLAKESPGLAQWLLDDPLRHVAARDQVADLSAFEQIVSGRPARYGPDGSLIAPAVPTLSGAVFRDAIDKAKLDLWETIRQVAKPSESVEQQDQVLEAIRRTNDNGRPYDQNLADVQAEAAKGPPPKGAIEAYAEKRIAELKAAGAGQAKDYGALSRTKAGKFLVGALEQGPALLGATAVSAAAAPVLGPAAPLAGVAYWTALTYGPLAAEVEQLQGPDGQKLTNDQVRERTFLPSLTGAAALELGLGRLVARLPGAPALLKDTGNRAAAKILVDPSFADAVGRQLAHFGEEQVAGALGLGIQSVVNGAAADYARAAVDPTYKPDPARVVHDAVASLPEAIATLIPYSLVGAGRALLAEHGQRLAAQQNAATLRALGDTMQAAKLFQTHPRETRQLIADIKQRAGLNPADQVDAVYVTLPQFQRYAQEQRVDPRDLAAEVLGDGGKAYDQAVQEKAEHLTIPLEQAAQFATKDNGAHWNALFQDMTLKPGVNTPRQDAEYEKRFVDRRKELAGVEPDKMESDQRRVYDAYREQAIETGADERTASANASWYSASLKTLAEVAGRGETAWDLWQVHPLNIKGERPTTAQDHQKAAYAEYDAHVAATAWSFLRTGEGLPDLAAAVRQRLAAEGRIKLPAELKEKLDRVQGEIAKLEGADEGPLKTPSKTRRVEVSLARGEEGLRVDLHDGRELPEGVRKKSVTLPSWLRVEDFLENRAAWEWTWAAVRGGPAAPEQLQRLVHRYMRQGLDAFPDVDRSRLQLGWSIARIAEGKGGKKFEAGRRSLEEWAALPESARAETPVPESAEARILGTMARETRFVSHGRFQDRKRFDVAKKWLAATEVDLDPSRFDYLSKLPSWYGDEAPTPAEAPGALEGLEARRAELAALNAEVEKAIGSAKITPKLDLEAAIAVLGSRHEAIPTEEGGIHPDDLARALGAPSGDQLLRDMAERKDRTEWAKARAAERLVKGEPLLQEAREEPRHAAGRIEDLPQREREVVEAQLDRGGAVPGRRSLPVLNGSDEQRFVDPLEELWRGEAGPLPDDKPIGRLYQEAIAPRPGAPVWHSAVENAISGAKIQQDRARPDEWWQKLTSTPGVKKEELDLLGVRAWLDQVKEVMAEPANRDSGEGPTREDKLLDLGIADPMKFKGAITRDDLLRFAQNRRLGVKERVLGDKPELDPVGQKLRQHLVDVLKKENVDVITDADGTHEFAVVDANGETHVIGFDDAVTLLNINQPAKAPEFVEDSDGSISGRFRRKQIEVIVDAGDKVLSLDKGDGFLWHTVDGEPIPHGQEALQRAAMWAYRDIDAAKQGQPLDPDAIELLKEELLDQAAEAKKLAADAQHRIEALQGLLERKPLDHDAPRWKREIGHQENDVATYQRTEQQFRDSAGVADQLKGKTVGRWEANVSAATRPHYEGYTQETHVPGSYRELLLYPDGAQAYSSPHFGDHARGLMAHIRVAEHVDQDGKKVLVFKEGQADLHQAGADQGYRDEKQRKADIATVQKWADEIASRPEHMADKLDRTWGWRSTEISGLPDVSPADLDKYHAPDDVVAAYGRLQDGIRANAVPDVPWKESWPELLVKRFLRFAADRGYDRVALEPGDVHARRWGTELIAWERYAPPTPEPTPADLRVREDTSGRTTWWHFELKDEKRAEAGPNPNLPDVVRVLKKAPGLSSGNGMEAGTVEEAAKLAAHRYGQFWPEDQRPSRRVMADGVTWEKVRDTFAGELEKFGELARPQDSEIIRAEREEATALAKKVRGVSSEPDLLKLFEERGPNYRARDLAHLTAILHHLWGFSLQHLTKEVRDETPSWMVSVKEQHRGHVAGMNLEDTAIARGLVKQGSPEHVGELTQLIELMRENLSRWNEDKVVKYANRVWNEMQGKEAGAIAPRADFYHLLYDVKFKGALEKLLKKYGGKLGRGALGDTEVQGRGFFNINRPGEGSFDSFEDMRADIDQRLRYRIKDLEASGEDPGLLKILKHQRGLIAKADNENSLASAFGLTSTGIKGRQQLLDIGKVWGVDLSDLVSDAHQDVYLGELPEAGRQRIQNEGMPLFQEGPLRGTLTLTQTGDDGKGPPRAPRGYIEIGGLGEGEPITIQLGAMHDRSTLAHESFHALSFIMGKIAERPDAPAGLKTDYQSLLTVMGYGSHAERMEAHRAGTGAAKEEKASHLWEQYLAEGKPPVPGLAGVFRFFKRALIRIYKGLQGIADQYQARYGEALPALTDEVRGVFDRLLATNDAIEKARRETEPRPPKDLEVLTPEERAAYDRLDQEDADEAHQELVGKAAADDKRETLEAARAEAERLRDTIGQALVAKDPAYRVLSLLQTGEFPGQKDPLGFFKNEDGSPLKLSREKTAELVGSEAMRLLPRGIFAPKGGQTPDELARRFGFADGKELLEAIKGKDYVGALRDETKRRVDEKYGPALVDDPERLDGAAREAVQTEAGAKKLWMRLQAMARELDPTVGRRLKGMSPDALREIAHQALGAKPVASISADIYASRERQHQARANRLWEEGKKEQALEAVEEAYWAHQFGLAARAIRAEVDAAEAKLIGSHGDAWRAAIGKASPAYRDGHDAILSSVGIGPFRAPEGVTRVERVNGLLLQLVRDGEARIEYEDYTAAGDPIGAPRIVVDGWDADRVLEVARQPRRWSELTANDALNLRDAILNIRHVSNELNQITVDGKRADRMAIIDEAIAAAQRNLPAQPRFHDDPLLGETLLRRLRLAGQAVDAIQLDVMSIANLLDGGNRDGIFHKLLVDRRRVARDKRDELTKRFLGAIVEKFEKSGLDRARLFEVIDTPELVLPANLAQLRDGRTRTRANLLMMLLNLGNGSNEERFLGGYQWSRDQVLHVLSKHLNAKEARWAQDVWDLLETGGADGGPSLYEEMARMHEEDKGLRPEKIQAKPFSFTTQDGEVVEMRGGYFPARYDPRAGSVKRTGEKQVAQDIADFLAGNYVGAPFVPSPHAKQRAAHFQDVVNLNWGIVPAHIAQVVHDISYRRFVRETAAILLDDRFNNMLVNRLGEKRAAILRPWLQDVAHGRSSSMEDGMRTVNQIVWKLKSVAAVSALGWSVPRAVADVATDPLIAVANGYVKLGHVGRAYVSALQDWSAARSFVLANSGEARQRLDLIDHRFRKLTDEMGGREGMKHPLLRRLRDSAFWTMEMGDRLVITPVWMARYEQSLAEYGKAAYEKDPRGLSEDEAHEAHLKAVRDADDVIAKILPPHDIADKPAIIRDHGLLGSLLLFAGHANKVGNMTRRDVAEVARQFRDPGASALDKTWSVGKLVGHVAALVAVNGLLAEYIAGKGKTDDEDWLEWVERKAIAGLYYPVALFSGPFEAITSRLLTGETKPVSVRGAPGFAFAQRQYDRLGREVEKWAGGDADAGTAVQQALELLLAFGVGGATRQATDTLGYAHDVAAGERTPKGPFDFAGGLIYGEDDKGSGNPLRDTQKLISGE